MRVLVAGGAGFIGSTFVRRRLDATSDSVVVLDLLTYAGNRANLADVESNPERQGRYQFVQGDIADAPLVKDLIGDVDAVVNFAAESHVDRSIIDSVAFLRTGVMGVHVLLEAVRETTSLGHRVRYVQVSTDEVYGSVATGQSAETDPVRPRSPYAAAKASGDLLVQAYGATYALDLVITRGANTYGPHQHPEKLIPLFVTNALEDLPLPMYGDGRQRRDWLHVDDHADAIGFLLDHGETGRVYNVPGSGERPNREVIGALLDRLAKPWSLVRSVPDRPGHDWRYSMSGLPLAELGWRRQVEFDAGITSTVDWYRQNQRWWRAAKGGDWADYYERQYRERLARSTRP